MTLSEQIREFNRWRRGDDRLPQPNPQELGKLLDCVADRLEALERKLEKYKNGKSK